MKKNKLFLLLSTLSFFAMVSASYAVPEPETSSENPEEIMPDAMSRIITAPNIDIENIRDPFLSSFEKNRIEEAKRFKNRKRLPSNQRKREPLEAFDLSTLSLVATFKKSGKDWVASVQDNTGQAYTVRHGNYMGKRGGRVEKIDDQTIYLVEQVISPTGEIVDRQVTLTLAEVNDN